ncbi:LPS export ABC transporter periplasmic protein LptC [Gracilimonas sp. Q87]|uniref:LPS export ABC transporter periplasmic protein LptC n=1 Tax=Gracilimonas sp. Q87 TaxID=3384766 RepID=UPI0039843631
MALFNIRSLFILTACTVLTISCGELSEYENQQVDMALSDSLLSTTESWGVNMEILEEERLKLRLKGSYTASIKNEARNITKISGPVFIEIFDENGESETVVHSDSAIYKPDDATFELFGNVEVLAPDNKRLNTEYLMWRRNEDMVSTPEALTIVTSTDSISAIGLEGDSNLRNYTLKEVSGETVVN